MNERLRRTERPRYLGDIETQEPGENSAWHSHEFGQLITAVSGSMYVGTTNRILLLSPATAVWIPPDAQHWLRFGSENVMRYVDVNHCEAKQLGSTCRIFAMTPLLGALFKATMPDGIASRTTRHTRALYALLRHEIKSAKDVPLSLIMPLDKRIRSFAEAALNDPGNIRSVEAWLTGAAASRKTLERLFVSETGMSPSRWLRHTRILHAVSLLANGEKVTTIAMDMGYESSSAFTYMFRQTLGVSPREFVMNRPQAIL